YYNLEKAIALSNDEQNKIKSLFEELRGSWSGQGTHTECFGPDSAPEERTSNVKLNLKTESNNALHIAFITEIKNMDNGITRQERINLIGKNPIFSFDAIANNHIIFSEKYRSASGVPQKDKKRFTRLIENVYEIKLMDNELLFIKYYYINGVYVAKDDWLLNPK
ncbi:MAG TPA: hypothetical protein VLM20_02100, partial [Methylophilaceae bacterium]|nr:hypothetical protein [Methylophilaceae bacterium]